MKSLKSIFILIFYFIFSVSIFAEIKFSNDFIKKKFSDLEIKTMYRDLCLNDKVSFSCFNNAMHGLEKIENLEIFDNSNDDLLVMVDYTKPSTEERLFIIIGLFVEGTPSFISSRLYLTISSPTLIGPGSLNF